MKIYYTYIPDKYEVNLYGEDLKDFKFRLNQFNRFNFRYLFAVYREKNILYLFLISNEEIKIFTTKKEAEEYRNTFPTGKVYPLSIAAYDSTKEIDNFNRRE